MKKLVLGLALVTLAIVVWSTLGAAGAADTVGTDEVRIQARKLSDGRIEFGLQQRTNNGQWGAEALPSGRFFPTDADVGRWLSSTPLTTVVRLDRPSQFLYNSGWSEHPDHDRIRYATQRQPGFDGANSYLVVDGRTNSREFPDARLIVSCRHMTRERPSEMWMIAAAFRGDSTPLRPRDTAPIAPLDDSNPIAYYRLEPWRSAPGTSLDGGWIRFDRAEEFVTYILTYDSSETVPPTLEVEAEVTPGNRLKMSFWSNDFNWGLWSVLWGAMSHCEKDRFESAVRIVARQLADGRVEFALQQRTATGWSDYMLPKVRKFPVNARVGNWLYSSSLELVTPDNYEERPRPMDGALDNGTHYSFAASDLASSVTVFGETDHPEHDLAEITIGCDGDPFEGQLGIRAMLLSTTTSTWFPDEPYESPHLDSDQWYTTQAYPVALGSARWPLRSDRRTHSPSSDSWRYNEPDNPGVTKQVIRQLQRGRELSMQFQFADEDDVITARVDVSDVFDTPAQPWLDWCDTWPFASLRSP